MISLIKERLSKTDSEKKMFLVELLQCQWLEKAIVSQGKVLLGCLNEIIKVEPLLKKAQDDLDFAGGAWEASLNHYAAGGNCYVTTQQVDESVYVVAQDDFSVARYTLDEWAGLDDQPDPPLIECDDAQQIGRAHV